MIPDRKILQAAVAVQTDATGSDPSHWHSNLDGTVAGETLLGPTCEKFLRGIRDRKSTRLNSSHITISYAVFCLKKKKKKKEEEKPKKKKKKKKTLTGGQDNENHK